MTMSRFPSFRAALLGAAAFALTLPLCAELTHTRLRCEYLVDPAGVETLRPRLSWELESTERGERQTAWQVLVASSEELLGKDRGDLWDSGKMDGDQTNQIVYAGSGLRSRVRCFWKVRSWDKDGKPSPWSGNARWTIGLLEMTDWSARWIDASAIRRPDAKRVAPVIRSAAYEAIDGSGSNDVTELLGHKAQNKTFSMKVENEELGKDPSFGHVKRLRIEYTLPAGTFVKTFPEKHNFRFPEDLSAPATVPYLRKSFKVGKPVARATVYATALGIFELRINGKRVGESILAPEWTDYNRRLRYQEHDVTALLANGENIVGAQVANGWYSGHIGNGGFQYWGKSPALLAQLEVVYQDGSIERIVTDRSWKSHVSPMLSSDFMHGEEYDARNEMPGWDRPGYNDSGWYGVAERDEPEREISGQVMEPVTQLCELQTKSVSEPKPRRWTFDLGQNMVGVVRLKVSAPEGTRITLRHAEMLNPDGTIYTDNLRGAPSIDTYICKGSGTEIWLPKFTFHGFRYVELTGLKSKPGNDTITGVVIGSATPKSGSFATSDDMVNRLQSNIEWGQRGNYLTVPTDCPQRDERLGWMGDAQVFVRTAAHNADVAAFFTKWLTDVTDSQDEKGRFADVAPFAGPSKGAPAWGDAGVICPWTIYQMYGDLRLLARQYPSMVKWVEYGEANSTGHIRDRERGNDYGDWLSINANTDKELLATAYHAYSTSLVAKSAEALGKTEDAARFGKLFEEIKTAFVDKYVSEDGRIKSDTQCAYLMALKFDLLPDSLRAAAADHLEKDIIAKSYHLSTGFVGVSYLLPELTRAGKIDTAYRLLHQDTFPSWLFSVKMGATTIWERWDGWTPEKGFQDIGMNSFNHYSLGSCGEWFYDTVLGIKAEEPGFKKIIIRPVPGGKLTKANGKYHSISGPIRSIWECSGDDFDLAVEIPANTTATVHVPAKGVDKVTESGKPAKDADGVSFLRMEGGYAVFKVGCGRYRFQSMNAGIDRGDGPSA